MARAGKTFIELLQTCRQSSFVDFRLDGATVRDLSLTSVGQLLRNNLRTARNLLGSGSSNSNPIPMYSGSSNRSVLESLGMVQRANGNKVTKHPIGLLVEEARTNQLVSLGDGFALQLPETLELHTTYLLPPAMGSQFLYQLQRQRKIWWMRWSVDPGRYFISDMRRDEADQGRTTAVSICARFLDRSEHAQMVELERLELSEGERVGERQAAIVRVGHNLDRAVLAILMDALECAASERCVKIHRKIAPYKCGIVCAGEDATGNWYDIYW